MPNTSYIALRNKFIEYGCFSIYQVLMWDPGFDSNNYTRWCRQGLLVRLRRGWFAFPELLKTGLLRPSHLKRTNRPEMFFWLRQGPLKRTKWPDLFFCGGSHQVICYEIC